MNEAPSAHGCLAPWARQAPCFTNRLGLGQSFRARRAHGQEYFQLLGPKMPDDLAQRGTSSGSACTGENGSPRQKKSKKSWRSRVMERHSPSEHTDTLTVTDTCTAHWLMKRSVRSSSVAVLLEVPRGSGHCARKLAAGVLRSKDATRGSWPYH